LRCARLACACPVLLRCRCLPAVLPAYPLP
jgi:hypothetical protein